MFSTVSSSLPSAFDLLDLLVGVLPWEAAQERDRDRDRLRFTSGGVAAKETERDRFLIGLCDCCKTDGYIPLPAKMITTYRIHRRRSRFLLLHVSPFFI